MMIGQQNLRKMLDVSADELPHTMMFVGESGCGKHTLVKELADRLSLPLIDITDELSYDLISEIQLSSKDAIYEINVNNFPERSQNIILKFAEEPPDNAYLALIANSTHGVLETVINRCSVFKFKPYSREELSQFSSDESILKYCRTPGQIKNAQENIKGIETLCDTIVTKLERARFDNALSIASKLNYKDEYDKYDISIFLNVLLMRLATECLKKTRHVYLRLYNIVCEYQSAIEDIRLNRKSLIENMIINMWRCVRDDVQRA